MEKCISACGYTQGTVYFRMCKFTFHVIFPMWKSVSPLAELHKIRWITACGDALFNVNPLIRKSAFPRMRIYTRFSELLLVEIYMILCKSTQASTCGHAKLWISQRVEIRIFSQISTCGNSSGKVHFLMHIYKNLNFCRSKHVGIHVFRGISTCRNVNSCMWNYT